jgi:hypothetical protein
MNVVATILDAVEIDFSDVKDEGTAQTVEELRMIHGGQPLVNFI